MNDDFAIFKVHQEMSKTEKAQNSSLAERSGSYFNLDSKCDERLF